MIHQRKSGVKGVMPQVTGLQEGEKWKRPAAYTLPAFLEKHVFLNRRGSNRLNEKDAIRSVLAADLLEISRNYR